jgi:L-ascorbate metabolism protein UlaG (beta-lactamase superfamily)
MPQIKWLGHSCVTITEGEHKLIVDPFLTDNPKAAEKADNIDVNWILLTHGHGDHVGDAVAIAKRTGATVIANFELANMMGSEGANVHPMHIGGSHQFPFGRVKLTIAHHGGGAGPDASRYTGPPVGFLINIGGKTIYHPGDTGLFLDMQLIGEMNVIDLAFLPIGDNFTMGVEDAVKAVEFLKPKVVIPFHYDTWDLIAADPKDFQKKVKGAKVEIIKPGGSYTV